MKLKVTTKETQFKVLITCWITDKLDEEEYELLYKSCRALGYECGGSNFYKVVDASEKTNELTRLIEGLKPAFEVSLAN